MLGGLKRRKPWQWLAAGKHPVAMDFFEIGGISPLSRAFAGWVDKGFGRWAAEKPPAGGMHAWRFWARGLKRHELAVGIGRDSSDRTGRSYPLLIMGTGVLPDWEARWDLLIAALDDCWNRLESIAARRYEHLKQLEDALGGLRRPSGDWADLKRDGLAQGPHNENYQRELARLQKTQSLCVPLNERHGRRTLPEATQWARAIKSRVRHSPSAVFLGGTPEKSFLMLFSTALRSEDFVRLWSVGQGGCAP